MLSKEEFDALPEDQQKSLLAKVKDIQDQQLLIKKEDEKLPQLSMKDFEGMVDGAFKKFVNGMDNVDKKYFMFPGIGNDGKMADNLTPEGKFGKTIKFLQAMVGKDVKTLKSMHQDVMTKANLSEGTATDGGFLVPEEFKAEVLRLAPQYGVLRREARIIPMAYDVVNIPAAGTTDLTAQWVNEAAQILSTDPDFRQVTLTINKLASIPKVTNELLADANVNVVQYLAELISEAFAQEEDNQGFNGTGSPFVGVLTATGVPTSPHAGGTAFIALSYQDLVNTTAGIYTNATANAKFYFHRSMVAHIRGLITTAGAPIIGSTAREVAGYPLIDTEILPGTAGANSKVDGTPYAIFGDLRKGMAMGERGSMTMKITTEGTVGGDNLFEKDMAALRMIERVAIGVVLPSAFTRIVS
jgi:HK97 family phage major capsid protein